MASNYPYAPPPPPPPPGSRPAGQDRDGRHGGRGDRGNHMNRNGHRGAFGSSSNLGHLPPGRQQSHGSNSAPQGTWNSGYSHPSTGQSSYPPNARIGFPPGAGQHTYPTPVIPVPYNAYPTAGSPNHHSFPPPGPPNVYPYPQSGLQPVPNAYHTTGAFPPPGSYPTPGSHASPGSHNGPVSSSPYTQYSHGSQNPHSGYAQGQNWHGQPHIHDRPYPITSNQSHFNNYSQNHLRQDSYSQRRGDGRFNNSRASNSPSFQGQKRKRDNDQLSNAGAQVSPGSTDAPGNQQSSKRSDHSRPLAPPSVPSFGFQGLPKKPEPPLTQKRIDDNGRNRNKKRKTNQLGMTPSTASGKTEPDDEIEDEEAAFAQSGQA
jgi:hypothetical protein